MQRVRFITMAGVLVAVVGSGILPIAPVCAGAPADPGTAMSPSAECLEAIVAGMPSVDVETRGRRNLAHMTFCLPQNVFGVLFYGLLRSIGGVVCAREMNEVTIVVTRGSLGVSLGRYLFVPASFLTETTVRHEYGHTLQGYRHGPFYLLFEGTISFVQAAISLASPAFARDYYDRWPEDEANRLAGVP